MEKKTIEHFFDTSAELKKAPKKHSIYTKVLFPLFFILLLLLCFFFKDTFLPTETETSSEVSVSEATIPLINPEQPVTRLQIKYKEEPDYVLLSNTNNTCSIEGEEYFTLDENITSTMLRHAQTFYAETSLKRPDDLKDYGLDKPWLEITINQTHFQIGNAVPTMLSWYALKDDDSCIYTVPRSLISSLARSLNDIHVCPQFNHLTDANIDYVYIQHNNGEIIEFSRAAADDSPIMTSFFLTLPYHYPAHAYRVSEDILPALPFLNPSAYVGHISNDTDAIYYGLDTPFVEIKASDNLGEKIHCRIGNLTGTSRYCTFNNTNDVYLLDNNLLEFLTYARTDYLAEQFPSLIRIEDVQSVDIVLNNKEYTLAISNDDSSARQFQLNEKELEADQGRALYEQIVSIQHDTKCSSLSQSASVYLSIHFSLLNGSNYLVEYLDVDEDYLAIRVEGETHFMVKRNKFDSLLSLLSNY